MKLILASKSPRRSEILKEFGIDFEVIPSTSKETYDKTHTPEKIVEEIAYSKTIEIANKYPDRKVLGADTIVVINNEILGKPKDEKDAIRMLKLLEGRIHQVITGVCIIEKGIVNSFHVSTDVEFEKMTDSQILEYIHSENVYDKAGSYAIQSKNAWFVKNIKGSFYNVVGLPIEKILEELKK